MFHKLLRLLNKDTVPNNNPTGKNMYKDNNKFTRLKCSLSSYSATRQQEGSLLNHVSSVTWVSLVKCFPGSRALFPTALVLRVILCFSYLVYLVTCVRFVFSVLSCLTCLLSYVTSYHLTLALRVLVPRIPQMPFVSRVLHGPCTNLTFCALTYPCFMCLRVSFLGGIYYSWNR